MGVNKQVRQQVKARDGGRCRACLEPLKHGLQLHHVLPQRLHGPHEAFNLVCLCHKCHEAWHHHEQKLGIEWDRKRIVGAFYTWLNGESQMQEEVDALNECYDLQADNEVDKLLSFKQPERYRNKPRGQ